MVTDHDPRNAGIIAASVRVAAAGFGHFPRCRVCTKPMLCGQDKSNRGAHYVCAPPTLKGTR